MADTTSEYERYFHVGVRVEIGIHAPNREIFREWGVVESFEEDQVLVTLSRDKLPENVRVEIGVILDVGVWVDQEVFTCRAIVTNKHSDKTLWLQLLSSMMLKERREFFRISAPLRVKHAYGEGQPLGRHRLEWEKRIKRESLRFQENLSGADASYLTALYPDLKPADSEQSWHEPVEDKVNLGGGGVRIKLNRRMQEGDYLDLEITLPLVPVRVVHAVAEVIYVLEPLMSPGRPEHGYLTGARFVYLEERDRDHIFRFISQEQLIQLRKLTGRFAPREPEENAAAASGRQRRQNWTVVLVLAVLAVLLLLWFVLRSGGPAGGPQGEIERVYEKELSKHRSRVGPK